MAVVAIVFLLKTAVVEVFVITIVTESVLVEVFLIKAVVALLVSCYELMQALLSPTLWEFCGWSPLHFIRADLHHHLTCLFNVLKCEICHQGVKLMLVIILFNRRDSLTKAGIQIRLKWRLWCFEQGSSCW